MEGTKRVGGESGDGRKGRERRGAAPNFKV